MSIPRRLAALTAALLAVTGAASAAPAATGEHLVTTGATDRSIPACASCHGMAGQGMRAQNNAPRLANLNSDYLQRQLDAFASGARKSAIMQPIAAKLTADEKAAAADYFAALAPSVEPGPSGAPDTGRGKVLAERGDWSVKAPACSACHGTAGAGVGSVTPPLAGQTQAYMLGQLQHFRDGDRKSEALGLMNGLSARLSPADLQAAAAYYAGLPLPKPGAHP